MVGWTCETDLSSYENEVHCQCAAVAKVERACNPDDWINARTNCDSTSECSAIVEMKNNGYNTCEEFCQDQKLQCAGAWNDISNKECQTEEAASSTETYSCTKPLSSFTSVQCACSPAYLCPASWGCDSHCYRMAENNFQVSTIVQDTISTLLISYFLVSLQNVKSTIVRNE